MALKSQRKMVTLIKIICSVIIVGSHNILGTSAGNYMVDPPEAMEENKISQIRVKLTCLRLQSHLQKLHPLEYFLWMKFDISDVFCPNLTLPRIQRPIFSSQDLQRGRKIGNGNLHDGLLAMVTCMMAYICWRVVVVLFKLFFLEESSWPMFLSTPARSLCLAVRYL
ncbi:hypothetical protein ES288_A03G150800v1 [Gossypium darwinii]|uniref:Uncharacterized protein n=2 Tax=Gossypium TaxID=3633 RepID=A0A5D2R9R0_GOSTO|nr:hypothetical protein ES288_A03G150800v1 [Gossypium darwinii]TYI36540.1 hypothetical protein ES332_A03G148300v1 [Gossypium tomentosum]